MPPIHADQGIFSYDEEKANVCEDRKSILNPRDDNKDVY